MAFLTQGKTNWKYILIVVILAVIVGGAISDCYSKFPGTEFLSIKPPKTETEDKTSKCEFNEMIFYYLDTCGWCQKVKNEGTISKIEELGVKINQINAKVGPIQHEFSGVPTFVINETVYAGYRTFEQLRELLGC